jgi:hypothetical protein
LQLKMLCNLEKKQHISWPSWIRIWLTGTLHCHIMRMPSATQQHGIVRMWTLMPVARQPVHLYPHFHFHIFVINIAKGIHTWRY